MEAYQNAALSPEERAKDLLGKMTLQEKVGQLNQRLYGFRIYERQGEEFTLTEEFKEEVERMGGLGVLYGLYRADPWADKDEKTGIVLELSAKAYNIVQKYVIDHSRLGIPMMMSTECPHGHQALGGGLLPVNLAAGATFDPELLSEGYKACGKQLKSGHVDLALMSALDMARDPRWGRSEECYSEDPCLAASMAKAAVTGMQSTGVGSVAKHFCAQGETTGGVNASAARIGERELREIHFPSAKACCEAGVEGIMAAYNEIDGVYCHRNAWLLRDVLRGEMGFDGIVMADGLAVDFLKNTEGDTLHAGVAARKAGVDVSLWDEAFSRLGEAVEQGLLDESEIDESVLKVLKLKFEKGLFEHPYMEENMLTPEEAGIPEVSLSLARESAVLLKNEESVLPLAKKYKELKIVLSVGGWGADGFSQAARTKEGRERFAASALAIVKEYGLDGIDIDWEYPGTSLAGIASDRSDKENYTLLLAELRKTLDAYREGMLVTTAVGGDVYFALQTDMKEASRYLDYVQLMTYDLQGGFQKVTGHHAALYHSEGNLFDACVQKAVNGFVNAGVPMEKLILGVPFYSRKWDGVKGAGCRNGLGMEAETVGGYGGDYGELKESWIGKRGFIRYWDEQAKVPYLFDGETFISYEDCESLGVKIAYLKEKGMGGIMFWEYKCDPSGELLSFIKKNM